MTANTLKALTLQNWVSRVSRIPGGIFGKLGGFSKSSLHVAALTKIQVIGYVYIVVPGEGLEPEIRNVETWGVGDIHWGC